jgi:hypothetical protein
MDNTFPSGNVLDCTAWEVIVLAAGLIGPGPAPDAPVDAVVVVPLAIRRARKSKHFVLILLYYRLNGSAPNWEK